ncbi:MAG: MerR family transcriptional regulator [Patescibacteria group bacterium]|nr:MerR family transcriptional regulator [Patescibacteria group bacterium]
MTLTVIEEEPPLSTQQVCALIGVTYRQLDYWTRTGHVRAIDDSCPGSGQRRAYSVDEVAKVRLIKRFLDMGMTLRASVYWTRQYVSGRQLTAELAEMVEAMVDAPELEEVGGE